MFEFFAAVGMLAVIVLVGDGLAMLVMNIESHREEHGRIRIELKVLRDENERIRVRIWDLEEHELSDDECVTPDKWC